MRSAIPDHVDLAALVLAAGAFGVVASLMDGDMLRRLRAETG
jgi:hypothetical protein